MTPLRIRSRLVNCFVARDPWSPAIDGILAAAIMRERLGAEEYAIGAASPMRWAIVEGLPLAVERQDGHWWYQASSPRPVGLAGQQRRYYHRRFDDHQERYLTTEIKRVTTSAGPYKGARLQDTRTLCRALEWHVVGDAFEIKRLLRRVAQVGGRRGIGYGEVAEWLVEAGGDVELARHARPLPAAYAARLGIAGPVLLRGLVPPFRCDPIDCVMPPPGSVDA